MEKWLDTAIQLMTDSPTEIANESRIDKSTWYLWVKDEAFRLWYRQEWDKRLAMVGATLDAIGLRQAKRDHKYWQDMQRRVGNFKDDSKGNVLIQQNFTEHVKNELKEFSE